MVKMQRLRERGIYELPNGKRYIAVAALRSGYCLYTPLAWEQYGLPDYETDDAGQLFNNDQPTHWHIADLIDTGRVVDDVMACE